MPNANQQLEYLRHSTSHLLAAAVLELHPDAKPTIGPAIDDGFYYDFEFASPISDLDLQKIEKRMRKLLPTWKDFTQEQVSIAKAKKQFSNNKYKQELIDEFAKKGEKITLYHSGSFTDLCRGGHVREPNKELQHFKLLSIAGAYWRGDEKNTMLTRIYGAAFQTKKELDDYITMRAEAKKRDHKKLGKELDLFVFSDLVGAGLPLFTPNGTLIRDLLDDYIGELRKARGYEKVEIPHITKKELYETSGHWDKFGDELFHIKTREGHEFVMKPMNCPHHTQIYARKLWSYRELPQRYANTTMVYRDEQTGELNGLSRVRAITQDDSHVFCRMDQVEAEILATWDIVEAFYGVFGFTLKPRLSLHDPDQKEKYLGTPSNWKKAESILRKLVKQKKTKAIEALGEAAFYGPKLDFIAYDAIGREWQVATIQLDFNMPERFNLTYINEQGKKEPVTMLHIAVMGAIERFLSILIEHYAGAFPLWLAPVQIALLPVGKDHRDAVNTLKNMMLESTPQLKNPLRIQIDESDDTVGNKIRRAASQKIPYTLVIGDKEVPKSGTWEPATELTIRKFGKRETNTISLENFLQEMSDKIQKRAQN